MVRFVLISTGAVKEMTPFLLKIEVGLNFKLCFDPGRLSCPRASCHLIIVEIRSNKIDKRHIKSTNIVM